MNGGNSDELNVADLVHTHNKRKNTRLKTYERIYRKCENKIKYINDVLLERETFFNISPFEVGLPIYQHNAALGFIMIKLRGKGFDVHYADDGSIYINWNKLVETAMNDSYPARQLTNADGIAMDIADTTVPKPSNIALKDDRFHKLQTEGCGGECCTEKKISSLDPTKKKINKKQKLEAARQQQQNRIQNMLKYKNY